MISQKEYELLKEYQSKGHEWIARDDDGLLYVFNKESIKYDEMYDIINNEGNWDIIDSLHDTFFNITWADNEPTKINNLIREYETSHALEKNNETVVIPQFVADWIEKNKGVYTLRMLFSETDMPNSVRKWTNGDNYNCNLMAKAWLYGYKVEKEKLYIVELPNHQRLAKVGDTIKFYNEQDWFDNNLKTKLTKAEIESVDARLMQFAEKVE